MERSRSSPDIFGILQKRIAALENNRIVDYSISDWIEPTLVGAWINYGGNEDTVGYWRSSSGLVLLKGVIAGGLIPGQIFTLPEGFRPKALKNIPIMSNDLFGYISVAPDGQVWAEVGSSARVELSGVVFRAEQ